MTGLPGDKNSKIRVGVLISVNMLRRFGMTPTSHLPMALANWSRFFGTRYQTALHSSELRTEFITCSKNGVLRP
jgi:hypothetical protein